MFYQNLKRIKSSGNMYKDPFYGSPSLFRIMENNGGELSDPIFIPPHTTTASNQVCEIGTLIFFVLILHKAVINKVVNYMNLIQTLVIEVLKRQI